MSIGTFVLEESIEENKSILATVIAQIISTVRVIIVYLLNYMQKVFSYFSEHPLQALLLITNMTILVS